PPLTQADEVAIAARYAALGLKGRPTPAALAEARAATRAEDPRIRSAALGALVRAADVSVATERWRAATVDVDPTVRRRAAERRRAVMARRPFDGPAVNGALRAALDDYDWQVRQSAEDLLGAGTPGQRSEISDGDSGRGTSP